LPLQSVFKRTARHEHGQGVRCVTEARCSRTSDALHVTTLGRASRYRTIGNTLDAGSIPAAASTGVFPGIGATRSPMRGGRGVSRARAGRLAPSRRDGSAEADLPLPLTITILPEAEPLLHYDAEVDGDDRASMPINDTLLRAAHGRAAPGSCAGSLVVCLPCLRDASAFVVAQDARERRVLP
jgi:hypothetical protein